MDCNPELWNRYVVVEQHSINMNNNQPTTPSNIPPPMPAAPPMQYAGQPPMPPAPYGYPSYGYPYPAPKKSGKGLANISLLVVPFALFGLVAELVSRQENFVLFIVVLLLDLGIHITGMVMGFIATARGVKQGLLGAVLNIVILLLILIVIVVQ